MRTFAKQVKFWLLALLLVATARAQLNELAVIVLRPLGSDQFTLDAGTLFADGRLVLSGSPTAAPLFLLALTPTQLAAVYGQPLFDASFWSDTSGAYRNFRRSAQTYTVFGNPQYIVSAAPVTPGATTISPPSRNVSATGATAQTITVSSNTTWSAVASATWITITGGATGSGNGTVSYNVAANTVAQERVATITISGQIHTVTQAANSAPPATRPPNDSRVAAEALPAAGPTVVRSSVNATREPGDPPLIAGNVSTATVWWSWTAPANVRATVSTIGSGFDTVLGIYSAAGSLIAENDDIDFVARLRTSQVSFDAITGQSYLIAVDGFLGATGSVALSVGFVPRGTGANSANARLANIATRAQVGTGGDVLIPGFVIGGTGQKTLLIRGVGPALTQFGVAGALADPTITLFRDSTVIATNDNWSAATNAAQIATTATASGAFALPAGSRDATILTTLGSGAYTVQMSGVAGGTGVGLVEIYEISGGATTARLVNIATRAQVGTGGNILIPGIVITGTGARKLLLRAIGPSLAQFGVAGVLRNPVLALFSDTTPIAANDDVGTNGNLADLIAAESAVGAFARQAGAADAGVLVTLAPGPYTLQVGGVSGGTGVALVEIYEVP